jgi:hypothetical protein
MREECKHFQSRTYASGEVARFCVLDLAPEAPWRCPDNCPRYERRMADVGWIHGTLIEPPIEDEPEAPVEEMTAVLSKAEAIVDGISAEAVAEARRRDQKEARARDARAARRRWFRRRS